MHYTSFTANPAPGVGAGAWTGPRATPNDTQLVATVATAHAHTRLELSTISYYRIEYYYHPIPNCRKYAGD